MPSFQLSAMEQHCGSTDKLQIARNLRAEYSEYPDAGIYEYVDSGGTPIIFVARTSQDLASLHASPYCSGIRRLL